MASLIGKNEIEVFKNFYKENGDRLRVDVANMELSSKDDEKSALLALSSDKDFQEQKYHPCLVNLTESLLHATYNSKAYVEALRKRSAVNFALNYFVNSAIDLKLCLEADYPNIERPRLYMEQANCFAQIQDLKNMVEAIDNCYNFMKNCSEISKDLMDEYLKEMETFLELNEFNFGGPQPAPPLLETAEIKKPHALNPNVSSSIKIKYNNNVETDYIAVQNIPCGEVLFLEKAYSHGFYTSAENKLVGFFFCDYCMAEAGNCIPCRTCVTLLYCSEDCRIDAWNDYHQWECDIIRANFLPDGMILSLRTVIKAACSGVIKDILTKRSIKPGKNSEPYLNMYGVWVDLANLRSRYSQGLLSCCENSVFMVEFLKKSNFISHLMSVSTLRNLSFDKLVDLIGGLLLRHNIQALQRSITINCTSPAFADFDETREKLRLVCLRFETFNAFCPMVSELPHSCLPNTNINFEGYTAVVKASKDIKAGDRIYRSTQNLSANTAFIPRSSTLNSLMIPCTCEACLNPKINSEIYNTFICTVCGENAVLVRLENPYLLCLECNTRSNASTIAIELGKYNFALESEDLATKIICLESLKSIANPHHLYIFEMYKSILHLLSLEGDKNKFLKAMEDFKNCSKTRNQHGDPYDYMRDIILICETFFQFLHINKEAIKEEEGLELLNIFSELIEEAKKIVDITFPPYQHLFFSLEVYLQRYRINHIYLKMY